MVKVDAKKVGLGVSFPKFLNIKIQHMNDCWSAYNLPSQTGNSMSYYSMKKSSNMIPSLPQLRATEEGWEELWYNAPVIWNRHVRNLDLMRQFFQIMRTPLQLISKGKYPQKLCIHIYIQDSTYLNELSLSEYKHLMISWIMKQEQ